MLSSLGLKPSNVTSLIDSEPTFKCTHCNEDFKTRAERDAHRRAVKKAEKESGEAGGLTDQ
jgi:hypothetical protein